MEMTMTDLLQAWLMPSVISAAFAFLLGIFWYHPKILGGKWAEARGLTVEQVGKPSSSSFIVSFPLWFLTALFFTFMIIYLDISGTAEIFLLGCLIWVAFAMPPIIMSSLYTGYPFGAVAIDASYQLAGYYLLALTHIVLYGLGWV
jgi:hypothetical protein